LNEEERYLFDLQGYLVIEDVLKTVELQKLNGLLDGYDLWNQPRGEDLFFDFWQNDDHQISAGPLHRWGKPFRHLIGHPRIASYLTELLGSQLRYDHGHAMLMRKGGAPFALHGGGVPWKPAISYQVADSQIRSGLLVVEYALCDHGETDGGFCAVPGSHKSNFVCPPSFKPLDGELGPWLRRIPLKAGSALIFTEALTHGTLPWTAAHERRALFYRYAPGHMAFVGRYREDGFEEEDIEYGAYPQASDIDDDDWSPLERRMLEPPYVHDRRDTAPTSP
jgi:hypothetical protein